MSPLVTTVIRDHHERIDGSGYPRGISGTDIHRLSGIAAIADVYDAVTSERAYQEAAPDAPDVQTVRLPGRAGAAEVPVDTLSEVAA